MGFKIDFIGLVCFVDQGTTQLAYFPDGRNKNGELGTIPPHDARIIVPIATDGEENVVKAEWPGTTESGSVRIFPIPEPVVLEISGLDGAGVNADQPNARLPRLSNDDSLEVDLARAKTIVRLTINAGTLTALEFEGSVVSQLVVPHDDMITIRAKIGDDTFGTIFLRPGTEIVLRNTSNDATGGQDENAHFRIYRQLAPNNRVGTVSEPDPDFDQLEDLESNHPDLRPNLGGSPGRVCSNVKGTGTGG